MATTTNYGWTTPDDTALVKDGASAIRSLGTSIDTTTKNLNPSTTLGDIQYRSSTANTNTRLAIGSSGQVLTVSSGVPAWTTIATGGTTLIATATPSAATTVSFTSIPTTYKTLLVVWDKVFQSADDVTFQLKLNNDSGSNYSFTGNQINESNTVTFSTLNAQTSMGNATLGPMLRTTTNSITPNATGNGALYIYNADQTTGHKIIEWKSMGYSGSAALRQLASATGIYIGTSAISQIDFIRSSTQTITGTVRLYGAS